MISICHFMIYGKNRITLNCFFPLNKRNWNYYHVLDLVELKYHVLSREYDVHQSYTLTKISVKISPLNERYHADIYFSFKFWNNYLSKVSIWNLSNISITKVEFPWWNCLFDIKCRMQMYSCIIVKLLIHYNTTDNYGNNI